jgi:prefoldin subunit 5
MARESVERLKDRIDELEAENEALQDQIDSREVRFGGFATLISTDKSTASAQ